MIDLQCWIMELQMKGFSYVVLRQRMQVKRMCGLDMGENYNRSKKENPEVKQCPQEKVEYIKDALRHFKLIQLWEVGMQRYLATMCYEHENYVNDIERKKQYKKDIVSATHKKSFLFLRNVRY